VRTAQLGEEFARMQPSLLGLARRITRDEDAAADVVQRAFVKVLLHASRFEGRAALRTWVWRIVANEALPWLRERSRRARKHAALADHGAVSAPHSVSPFDAFERRQQVERLGAALAKLSRRDQKLIERTFTAGRSASARPSTQRDSMSQRPLRARLYRARQRLGRALGDER
jgi:RNA polymerase sigma factor (sigma-70 family)